ncbi:MAG: DUF4423 domain-containing protein [Bdellovibrionales bacterium]|nr:DUF4423 domain-containing protein [Bdellovibrionales bacterium]
MARALSRRSAALEPAIPFYLAKLRSEYVARHQRNPKYSIRSFARDLRLDPSALSAVLRTKRKIPKKSLLTVAEALRLNSQQSHNFLQSHATADLRQLKQVESLYRLDENEHFQIIAEWEHYAILSLLQTYRPPGTISWASNALGLSPSRTQQIFGRLEAAGLVQRRGERYRSTGLRLTTSEDVASRALQQAHSNSLLRAQAKLKSLGPEMRDFSGLVCAVNLDQLDAARTLIRKFRTEFASLVEQGSRREVWQLSVQFFPLTSNCETSK